MRAFAADTVQLGATHLSRAAASLGSRHIQAAALESTGSRHLPEDSVTSKQSTAAYYIPREHIALPVSAGDAVKVMSRMFRDNNTSAGHAVTVRAEQPNINSGLHKYDPHHIRKSASQVHHLHSSETFPISSHQLAAHDIHVEVRPNIKMAPRTSSVGEVNISSRNPLSTGEVIKLIAAMHSPKTVSAKPGSFPKLHIVGALG